MDTVPDIPAFDPLMRPGRLSGFGFRLRVKGGGGLRCAGLRSNLALTRIGEGEGKVHVRLGLSCRHDIPRHWCDGVEASGWDCSLSLSLPLRYATG